MVSKPKSKAQTNRGKPKAENSGKRKSKRVDDAEFFKAVVEHSYDAILFLDSEQKIFYASPSITQISGYEPEELIGKSGIEFNHPADREATTQKFLDLLQNPGKSISIENRLKHKNGSWFWVDSTATNFLDHPQVQAVVLNMRGITERKQTEQALRESETLYRQAIEVAGAVPYYESYYDENRKVKYDFIGEGIRQITGYGPEEFTAALWDSLILDIHLVDELAGYSLDEAIQRVRSGESSIWKCEHRIRHRNGEIRWVFEAAVEQRDENGVSYGSIGMYQDITARKLAEVALRESQQRLSLFFNQSLDGFFFSMIDEPIEWNAASDKEKLLDYVITHQHITEANNAMIEQYGSTREKFIGRTGSDFFAHDLEQARRFRKNLFDSGHLHLETEERKDDGTPIWIEGDYVCMVDDQSRITGMFGIQRDVTSRKRAEEILQEAEIKYRNLVERLPQVIYTSELGTNEGWKYVSPQIEKLLGFTPEEWMNNPGLWYQQVHPDDRDIQLALEEQAYARNEPFETEYRILTHGGNWIWIRDSGHIFPPQGYGLPIVQGMLMDITERKEIEIKLHASEDVLRSTMESPKEINIVSINRNYEYLSFNTFHKDSMKQAYGIDVNNGMNLLDCILDDNERMKAKAFFDRALAGESYTSVEQYGTLNIYFWETKYSPIVNNKNEIVGATAFSLNITERRQAEDNHRKAEAKYRMLVEQIPPIIYLTLPGQDVGVTYISPQIKTLGFTEKEWVANPELWLRQIHPDDLAMVTEYIERISQSGEPYKLEYRLITRTGVVRWFIDEVKDIVDETGNILFRQGFMLDITERKQAEELIQKQLRRLNALHTIDMAINSSANVQITLEVLLSQTLSQLNMDAADVLLFNQPAQTLELIASRGFRSNIALQSHQRLGDGFAGQVINGRRTIHISNLMEVGKNLRQMHLLAHDSFTEYFGVPLIAKGQIKGVLEIYHRSPLNPADDWLNFLEVLAGQAAIAIDNSQLVNGLQRSNMELVLAYDATIEGWSRAMDLRDKETEGHTQRVTTLTLKLARAMGIREADVIYIQRGGLLHDIGKLGVPDGILLKPGKLTEEEWEIMRQHPTYALNMLSPIIYLKQALDIPYCHHEKWDGTGYPQGLQGEQIPLAARIFAVIDVWDALTSDRPYRKAWTKEQTIEFIKEQSEKHFDPQVVKAFLEMISADG